jgi:hypothetical protein
MPDNWAMERGQSDLCKYPVHTVSDKSGKPNSSPFSSRLEGTPFGMRSLSGCTPIPALPPQYRFISLLAQVNLLQCSVRAVPSAAISELDAKLRACKSIGMPFDNFANLYSHAVGTQLPNMETMLAFR